MKKILLLMLCALTICTLFIIPASAAGYQIAGTFSCGSYAVDAPEPVAGPAVLTLFDNGNTYSMLFELEPGTCATSYDPVPDLGIELVEICFSNGSVSICALNDVYEPAEIFCDFILDYQASGDDPIVGASIWDVLTGAGNYIAESLNSATALFYNAEAATLTPVGTLSLVAVAIGLAILIVVLLRNYLHLG